MSGDRAAAARLPRTASGPAAYRRAAAVRRAAPAGRTAPGPPAPPVDMPLQDPLPGRAPVDLLRAPCHHDLPPEIALSGRRAGT